ncbi:hypothetical protein V1514DRAFT_333344 [Lipomyces japonicus]|uniref:uncharacterized protein n=1 Tax=Lipomyces japonicus TaxID=56871 RepID=UPI0034CF8D67
MEVTKIKQHRVKEFVNSQILLQNQHLSPIQNSIDRIANIPEITPLKIQSEKRDDETDSSLLDQYQVEYEQVDDSGMTKASNDFNEPLQDISNEPITYTKPFEKPRRRPMKDSNNSSNKTKRVNKTETSSSRKNASKKKPWKDVKSMVSKLATIDSLSNQRLTLAHISQAGIFNHVKRSNLSTPQDPGGGLPDLTFTNINKLADLPKEAKKSSTSGTKKITDLYRGIETGEYCNQEYSMSKDEDCLLEHIDNGVTDKVTPRSSTSGSKIVEQLERRAEEVIESMDKSLFTSDIINAANLDYPPPQIQYLAHEDRDANTHQSMDMLAHLAILPNNFDMTIFEQALQELEKYRKQFPDTFLGENFTQSPNRSVYESIPIYAEQNVSDMVITSTRDGRDDISGFLQLPVIFGNEENYSGQHDERRESDDATYMADGSNNQDDLSLIRQMQSYPNSSHSHDMDEYIVYPNIEDREDDHSTDIESANKFKAFNSEMLITNYAHDLSTHSGFFELTTNDWELRNLDDAEPPKFMPNRIY